MIQDIFIIDGKNENPCVFYGQIEPSPQPPNLAEILTMLIKKVQSVPLGKNDTIQTGQGKFHVRNLGKIYVILKVLPTADLNFCEKFLESIGERFLKKYEKDLDAYGGDVSIFAGFSEIAAETYSNLQNTTSKNPEPTTMEKVKLTPLPSKPTLSKAIPPSPAMNKSAVAKSPSSPGISKPSPQPTPSQATSTTNIKPMKREAYPEGIPEYSRDEVLWNESQTVMQEYSAEFVEDSVSKLSFSLSISLTHHYSVEIDFTNYPERPLLAISEGLQAEIGQSLVEILSIMKNWDPKIPPHIIELVRELELFLTRLKTQGKLSPTTEMPETALPDLTPLQPLPKLTPEEEKRIKKYEEQKKTAKLATEKNSTKKTQATGPTKPPAPEAKSLSPKTTTEKPKEIDKKELKKLEKEKKHQEKQKGKEEKQKMAQKNHKEDGGNKPAQLAKDSPTTNPSSDDTSDEPQPEEENEDE